MSSHERAMAGSVAGLWRYPVKSMAGEALDRSVVTDGGLLGDRAYAVIDRANGKVASAKLPKKWAGLLELGAAFVEPPRPRSPPPPVRVTWPTGEAVVSGGADADARLSGTLGRPVTLTTVRPERASLERLDPLAAAEVIVDIGALMMAGRFSDYAAFHLITTATIARLSALGPGSCFDPRRFRPNIVIETGGAPGFVENDWVGRTLAIGTEVRLRVSDPTPRCSVPTLGQRGLARDPDVLRTIMARNRLPVALLDGEELPCAGVYAFVIEGGVVRGGDAVRVL